MSDSDSDELSVPGFSDMESEHPGTSTVDSNQQLGVNVCSLSVDPITEPSLSSIGCSPPTRSVHYNGNRSGHAPVEEAESCRGKNFLSPQTSWLLKKIPHPLFRVTVVGPWVEEEVCG